MTVAAQACIIGALENGGIKTAGAGLRHSLLLKAQRAALDEIGRALGTPVIYLKAAWAEPVLYGGQGARTGSDIDILVDPACFEPFAQRLADQGFRRYGNRSPTFERYFGHKEWSHFDPTGRALPVDLHRGLTDPIWFDLPADQLFARAVTYDSVDGPILSLAPEDQLLYAAIHYASHLYRIDGRHLEDCRRLVETYPIDWGVVEARARAAHVRLPLAVMLDALQARGARLPARAAGRGPALRRRLLDHWVTRGPLPQCPRGRFASKVRDFVVLRPLLSDRIDALPRALVTFGLPWLRERLPRRLRSTIAHRG
jgi:hypothetical protein